MNYNNFIGYFFLVLLAVYDGSSEELEALNKEVRSIRKENALMRKELALVREEVARINAGVVPVKPAADIAGRANLAVE